MKYAAGWLTFTNPLNADGDDPRWNSNPNPCQLANVTCKTRDKGQLEKSRISCHCRDKETANRVSISSFPSCHIEWTFPKSLLPKDKSTYLDISCYIIHSMKSTLKKLHQLNYKSVIKLRRNYIILCLKIDLLFPRTIKSNKLAAGKRRLTLTKLLFHSSWLPTQFSEFLDQPRLFVLFFACSKRFWPFQRTLSTRKI